MERTTFQMNSKFIAVRSFVGAPFPRVLLSSPYLDRRNKSTFCANEHQTALANLLQGEPSAIQRDVIFATYTPDENGSFGLLHSLRQDWRRLQSRPDRGLRGIFWRISTRTLIQQLHSEGHRRMHANRHTKCALLRALSLEHFLVMAKRTYEEERRFIQRETDTCFKIETGFVDNMKVALCKMLAQMPMTLLFILVRTDFSKVVEEFVSDRNSPAARLNTTASHSAISMCSPFRTQLSSRLSWTQKQSPWYLWEPCA